MLLIGFPGKNRVMHPHRVQLLHAEVPVHPHRVQMHPVLVHFGDYDRVSQIRKLEVLQLILNSTTPHFLLQYDHNYYFLQKQ